MHHIESSLKLAQSRRSTPESFVRVRAGARWLEVAALVMAVSGGITATPSAAAELSVSNVAIQSGGGATVSVRFRANGDTVAALQFDLQYDSSVFSITSTAGSAASAAGKSLVTSTLNGRRRVVLVGFNNSAISDGSVVALTIHVDSRARPGQYILQILAPVGAGGGSRAVPIQVTPATITVR